MKQLFKLIHIYHLIYILEQAASEKIQLFKNPCIFLWRQKGAVAKWLSEKILHKTRNLFGAKQLKKDSGFLLLRYFFVPGAIAFLFCNSPIFCYLSFFSSSRTEYGIARLPQPVPMEMCVLRVPW